jgi:hypothetical protein
MGLFTPYIEEQLANNIKAYKYNAIDNSILYTYITSPICNKLVKLIPSYIA